MTKKKTTYRNKIKIIAGSKRSRLIHFPDIEGLRPTLGVMRERLFNWLGQELSGKKVLDLFSGSGALAFEAASRGAKEVVAVEKNHPACVAIAQNSCALGLETVKVCERDVLAFLKESREKFDILFIDPPYSWDQCKKIWPLLQNVLTSDGLVYLEGKKNLHLPENIDILKESRLHGQHYYLTTLISGPCLQ